MRKSNIIATLAWISVCIILSGCGITNNPMFDPEYRELLRTIQRLDDSDPAVRERAAYRLAYDGWQVWTDASDKMYDIIRNDESDDVRIAALTAFDTQVASPSDRVSQDLLLGLLSDDNPKIRAKAVGILAFFSGVSFEEPGRATGRDFSAQLKPMLKDEDPSVRIAAIRGIFTAGRIPRPYNGQVAPDDLLAMLDDEDASVRSEAAWSIAGASNAPPEIVDIFIDELSDPLKMIDALGSIALMGEAASDAAPKLREVIDKMRGYDPVLDKIPWNASCDEAITRLESIRPGSIMAAILKDMRPDSVQWSGGEDGYSAGFVIHWNNGRRERLGQSSYLETSAYTQAIRALASIGFEDEASNEISKLLDGEYSDDLKFRVIIALERENFPVEFALAELVKILHHVDPYIRNAAVYAVGGMGIEARDASPDVLPLLGDPDAGVRFNAAKTLGALAIYSDEIVTALAKTASTDANSEVRGVAKESYDKLERDKEGLIQRQEDEKKEKAALEKLESGDPEERIEGFTDLSMSMSLTGKVEAKRQEIWDILENDEDDRVRIAAIRFVSNSIIYPTSGDIDAVLKLLDDDNPEIRIEALQLANRLAYLTDDPAGAQVMLETR